jgi:hypothetical protein
MRGDADERIDRLIDRAAASMTEAETSSAFVGRLMAALDEPARPLRQAWRPALVPAAACALLAFVLGAWWIPGRGPQTDGSATHLLVSRRVPTTMLALVSPSAPGPLPTDQATAAATPRRSRRPSPAPAPVPDFPSIAIDEVEIAPVAAADGAELAPLAVEPLPLIEVDDIALDPIDLTQPPRADRPPPPGERR